MKIEPALFEKARLAVIDEMGWEDDRKVPGEYGSAMWDLAGELVVRVVEAIAPDNRVRGKQPRGTCPVCGKEYALSGGTLRNHDAGFAKRCAGSGGLPAEAGVEGRPNG